MAENMFDSFFDESLLQEDNRPITMDADEYFKRTKKMLESIVSEFGKSFSRVSLTDEEYPDENYCDKCDGCGLFNSSGDEKECQQDKEAGECIKVVLNFEDMWDTISDNIDELYELSYVNQLTK